MLLQRDQLAMDSLAQGESPVQFQDTPTRNQASKLSKRLIQDDSSSFDSDSEEHREEEQQNCPLDSTEQHDLGQNTHNFTA